MTISLLEMASHGIKAPTSFTLPRNTVSSHKYLPNFDSMFRSGHAKKTTTKKSLEVEKPLQKNRVKSFSAALPSLFFTGFSNISFLRGSMNNCQRSQNNFQRCTLHTACFSTDSSPRCSCLSALAIFLLSIIRLHCLHRIA